LNYVDEGEQNQGFPWDEVGTEEREFFEWDMALRRSLTKALNRLNQSEAEHRARNLPGRRALRVV
jgi:hypothetical protein